MIKGKRLIELAEMKGVPTRNEIRDLTATYMAFINSQEKNKPTKEDGMAAMCAVNLLMKYCERWGSTCKGCVFHSLGADTCAFAWGEKSIHNPTQWKM